MDSDALCKQKNFYESEVIILKYVLLSLSGNRISHLELVIVAMSQYWELV